MRVADFDFDLPPELIAQEPASTRDRSRLLVVDRAAGEFHETVFADIGRWLRRGDLLVVNDTRVFPARLVGHRAASGGRVELFLVREEEPGVWEVLARPAARVRPGDRLAFGDGDDRLEADVVERRDGGRRAVRFPAADRFWVLLDRWGRTPLPPYIRRDEAEPERRYDRDRYQTVYARERGAIAAPTAGLHFTPELLQDLDREGVERTAVTLHVGYGTFQPVRVERVEDHRVEPEYYDVPEAAAGAVNRARHDGRRVVVVGTTTTRALESAVDDAGRLHAGPGRSDLFIRPGHEFRAVDALITNFHLPRSSLLMLVAAFASRDLILAAYRHAVDRGFRFYSYGDAMLIV
jgi:S-adenosylmethionine:tRNA ribosyltransferase-isomerase